MVLPYWSCAPTTAVIGVPAVAVDGMLTASFDVAAAETTTPTLAVATKVELLIGLGRRSAACPPPGSQRGHAAPDWQLSHKLGD